MYTYVYLQCIFIHIKIVIDNIDRFEDKIKMTIQQSTFYIIYIYIYIYIHTN